MTNFIIDKPRIVFIHLPKTGGTSVRDALGKLEGRYFGHVPEHFQDRHSLVVVREPKARFLSAFRMFKYGNKLEGDYYAEPRWPDLSITQALDVLEDPWIGFDRSHRDIPWNFKHHIIPQTHPFNCLFYADTVLRFETLGEDFGSFCAKVASTHSCLAFAHPATVKDTRSSGGRRMKSASYAYLPTTIAFWGIIQAALNPKNNDMTSNL